MRLKKIRMNVKIILTWKQKAKDPIALLLANNEKYTDTLW